MNKIIILLSLVLLISFSNIKGQVNTLSYSGINNISLGATLDNLNLILKENIEIEDIKTKVKNQFFDCKFDTLNLVRNNQNLVLIFNNCRDNKKKKSSKVLFGIHTKSKKIKTIHNVRIGNSLDVLLDKLGSTSYKKHTISVNGIEQIELVVLDSKGISLIYYTLQNNIVIGFACEEATYE